MLGFLIESRATPRLSRDHHLLAVATSVYLLVAIRIEEKFPTLEARRPG